MFINVQIFFFLFMDAFSDEKAVRTAQLLKEAKEDFEGFANSVRTNSLDVC